MSERARQLTVGGAYAFTTPAFPDERGVFLSPYQQAVFVEALGHPLFAVAQCSYSVSRRGVVRGVHYTATPPGCAKYVYCPSGRVLDIVVDLRVGSPTFGVHDAVELGGPDFPAVYLPVGVGHMFVALEEGTTMTYLLSTEYRPENELAVTALDPTLELPIPRDITPLLSERDRQAIKLREALSRGLLPSYDASGQAEAALYVRPERAAPDR
ncbi:dTDP-4-dehydrorhamnose 3,5-epimerase [Actinoplanes sp. ATCC 53533]|uniref:dTDP-4-dehydrorhamnose 3,5-epimerase family protein n=1 Tax=Actinoplanes sp. ATCC 53533 TaxID=1288362 RepID=UPI0003875448|nr:dTDP-4-dehydrorhamnose 3,5-epimerase family protein [Actinoplanes sp. ATCC 53533]AGS77312.1 Epimerase [Actinoplanes sp. ATCC 53533]RSM42868.1 dTDP-4-dehydrorhamnose 3,5-epimerase [Actinoplanes sp. ATCC 53533]